MSNKVKEIKDRLDIINVIGSYIKLQKSGSSHKACCPFHNEKTPSFHVSSERGAFYCFGCGAKGDIFSFVEKFEGLDFMGSLKVLADRAGVKLDDHSFSKEETKKETLYKILEEATLFFEKNLEKDLASKDYVLGRGIKEKTIEKFRIGYAPNDWRSLRNYLKQKGFKDIDVVSVGLIKRSEKASSDPYYDVFRDRIIFPISDSSGRVVAFTGRAIDDKQNPPKYLNSPETVLFSKSKILYGLDKAKMDIRTRDYSIIVEGQMDAVMLHQAGFTNTVAVSGTAFVDEKGEDSAFNLLTRLSENIVISFDSDSAGIKAVKRVVPAISLGMNIKIIDIKGGKDPADLIKSDPKQWVKMLETKKDFIDYLVDQIIDSNRGSSPNIIRQTIEKDIYPYLIKIPTDTSKFQSIKKISEKLHINEDALWKDLQEYSKKNLEDLLKKKKINDPPIKNKKVNRIEKIEKKILGIINSDKLLKDKESAKKDFFELVKDIDIKNENSLDNQEINSLVLEAELTYEKDVNIEKEYKTLLLSLEEEYINKKLEELTPELYKLEKSNADFSEMAKKIEELSKRKQNIKQLLIRL